MKHLVAVTFLLSLSLVACANVQAPPSEPLKVEKQAKKSEPIFVVGPGEKLATIDPDTLKITYEKNADPKKVTEYVIRAWADTTAALKACQESKK